MRFLRNVHRSLLDPYPTVSAAEIYETTLNRFNIKAEQSIFIDDNLRNIEAANALGINGVHFKNSKLLIEQLKAYNINI